MSRIGNLSSRIFVGGLDPSVDESDLEKAFALFGDITNVMVMRDRENGRSRGFAFISFKDSQSSEEAISRMHGVEIRGRCVTVRHAERERFVDDKQPSRGVSTRGGGGFRNTSSRSSYGLEHGRSSGRHWKVSETVFVTEDESDRSHNAPRRSISPDNRGWGRYRGDRVERSTQYRDRSPLSRNNQGYERDVSFARRGEKPQFGDRQYGAAERLSPTGELTAYIHARGRSYSPLLNLAKRFSTDDDSKFGRSQTTRKDGFHAYNEYSSSKQKPQLESFSSQYGGARTYEHDRQPMRERRVSPEASRRTSPRMSRSTDAYRRLQRDDKPSSPPRRGISASDFRKVRRSSPVKQSPMPDRRTDSYGERSGLGGNDSWDRGNRQRSPVSRQSGWSRDSERISRDVDRGRVQQTSFRENRPASTRADFVSNGKGSMSQTSWGRRDRDEGQRAQDRTSDQGWRRGTHNKEFGTRRGSGRTDEYRGGADYRRDRYGDEDKGGRSAGSFRRTSPIRGRAGRGSGNRQYSGARRY